MSSPPPRTTREDFIRATLSKILEATDYRLGAMVLTCAPTPGLGDVRLVSAIVLKASTDGAADLAALPHRLRELADQLEAVVRGKAPLPPQ